MFEKEKWERESARVLRSWEFVVMFLENTLSWGVRDS
jgi:hypothetical protein